jgi:hypothetical protein
MSGLVLAAALAVLAAGPAMPQMLSSDDRAVHTLQQPYDVETFGAFRNIMLSGDFIGRVGLDAVMTRHPTTGVGALADALGEITICNELWQGATYQFRVRTGRTIGDRTG